MPAKAGTGAQRGILAPTQAPPANDAPALSGRLARQISAKPARILRAGRRSPGRRQGAARGRAAGA